MYVGPARTFVSERVRHSESLFRFICAGLDAKRDRNDRVEFPSTFSFIDAPEETIETLRAIASASRKARGREVYLDQSGCTQIDYGAEAAAYAVTQAAYEGLGVAYVGWMPENDEQRKIAKATGLPQMHRGVPPPRPGAFETLGLQHGGKGEYFAYKSCEAEVMASRLTDYLSRCFQRYGRRLTIEAEEVLLDLFGEVMGNTEDHGRGDWWVGAYLHDRNGQYGDCHLAILNFGRSIYETLQDLPANSSLRAELEKRARSHRGFFGNGYGEEQLWTLFAVQDGVGRFFEEKKDRGRGLAVMVESFQTLGGIAPDGTPPRRDGPILSVVSGRTALRFDQRHPLQKKMIRGAERRVVALNDGNDLDRPPDSRNVRRLRAYFPGTVISLRFDIDPEYLEQFAEATGTHGETRN